MTLLDLLGEGGKHLLVVGMVGHLEGRDQMCLRVHCRLHIVTAVKAVFAVHHGGLGICEVWRSTRGTVLIRGKMGRLLDFFFLPVKNPQKRK